MGEEGPWAVAGIYSRGEVFLGIDHNVKVKVWIKRGCDEFNICEYVEIPLARAADIIDRIDPRNLYIIVEDIDPKTLEEFA